MKIKCDNIEMNLVKRGSQDKIGTVWRNPYSNLEEIEPGDTVTLRPVKGTVEPFIVDNEIRVLVASNNNNAITGILDLCDGVSTAVKVEFDKDYVWFCSKGRKGE